MNESDKAEQNKTAAAGSPNTAEEVDAVRRILELLVGLPETSQQKVLRTVSSFFGYSEGEAAQSNSKGSAISSQSYERRGHAPMSLGLDPTLSAKEFLLEKRPVTDIERITCLAYYLAHYKEQKTFKTADLSKLNTEAAQPKFANATWAADNSVRAGLLISGAKGSKQLGAAGELYVQALPDREAAKASIAHIRPRRKKQSAKDEE